MRTSRAHLLQEIPTKLWMVNSMSGIIWKVNRTLHHIKIWKIATFWDKRGRAEDSIFRIAWEQFLLKQDLLYSTGKPNSPNATTITTYAYIWNKQLHFGFHNQGNVRLHKEVKIFFIKHACYVVIPCMTTRRNEQPKIQNLPRHVQ